MTHLQEALPELEQLRKKLAELKRLLDDEQLKKADLENQCARLEEDLKFKLQLLEKELAEVRNDITFDIVYDIDNDVSCSIKVEMTRYLNVMSHLSVPESPQC